MGLMGMSSEDDKGAYESLQQNLVGPAPDQVLRTAVATPMVEVVAPANLREGYEFDAQIGGQAFKVTVPPGGIEQGQKFSVPYGGNIVSTRTMNVPVGAWKDSIFNCFEYGPCHNHLCLSCWCVPIATGQAISRLKLNWKGKPGTIEETTGVFESILYPTIAFWLVYFMIKIGIGDGDVNPANASDFVVLLVFIRTCLLYTYLAFCVYIVWNVRAHVRKKYAIPEHEACPTGCEDFGVALCCTHLAIAQILRHTADYDTYNSTCCTETGLPSNAPSMV